MPFQLGSKMNKPTLDNFKKWLFKTCGTIHKTTVFTHLDLEATEECFKIFLGNYSFDKFRGMSSYKDLRDDFMKPNRNFNADTIEDYKETKRILYSFREPIIGYSCEDNFTCSSVKPKFKDYTFCIWHEYGNTQVFINRKDEEHAILRFEWDDLFKAMYDFFSPDKKEQIQLSLF